MFRTPYLTSIAALVLAAAAVGALPPLTATRADAQLSSGIGVAVSRCSDGATIAWSARSSDGTKEFWAYIQGDFEFAAASHTASNPWNVRGVYDSALPTGGFDAFRTEVLARPAAQGKTIIFHNMTVSESVTVN